MEASQTSGTPGYPVQLAIEYPHEPLNRLTTAFRIFVAIPILIVIGTLGAHEGAYSGRAGHGAGIAGGTAGLLALGPALMTDHYPSTDEEQAVRLDFPYPDAKEGLNRWLPIVKWLLAIPHYIVLFFLWIAAIVSIVIAWFAILFTGQYPQGLFTFVEGVIRWTNRVVGYAVILVTDEYPPFRLSP